MPTSFIFAPPRHIGPILLGSGQEKSHLGISGAFPRHRPSTTAKNGAAAKFMTLMHALFSGAGERGGAKQGLNNIGLK